MQYLQGIVTPFCPVSVDIEQGVPLYSKVTNRLDLNNDIMRFVGKRSFETVTGQSSLDLNPSDHPRSVASKVLASIGGFGCWDVFALVA